MRKVGFWAGSSVAAGTCGYGLPPKTCGAPAAYEITSKTTNVVATRWLCCIDHACQARTEDWVESIRTYHP